MKKLLIGIFVALSMGLFVPVALGADITYAQSPIQDGINATCPNGACPTNGPSVNSTVEQIINIFSWIVGVVSVLMIMFGGFKYITSAGDAGKVTSAKNTILYAIVGLVIVALAQVIVQFVLTKAT